VHKIFVLSQVLHWYSSITTRYITFLLMLINTDFPKSTCISFNHKSQCNLHQLLVHPCALQRSQWLREFCLILSLSLKEVKFQQMLKRRDHKKRSPVYTGFVVFFSNTCKFKLSSSVSNFSSYRFPWSFVTNTKVSKLYEHKFPIRDSSHIFLRDFRGCQVQISIVAQFY